MRCAMLAVLLYSTTSYSYIPGIAKERKNGKKTKKNNVKKAKKFRKVPQPKILSSAITG